MEILSVDDDSNTYLEHVIIVDTLTDNGYDNTDFQSENEWQNVEYRSTYSTDVSSQINKCEAEPPPDKQTILNSLTQHNLRPICIRILRADEHQKDLTSYDAELYSRYNDGNNDYLNNIDTPLNSIPSTSEISTYNILTQQHDIPNNVFPLEHCSKA